MSALVEARGVVKDYPGVRALEGVSFAVGPGEIVGLVGENGAGKSTLMKVLSGQIQPDAGTLLVSGEEVVLRSPAEARAHGIEIVPQEVVLVGELSVAENLTLGHPPSARGRVQWRSLRAAAAEVAERVRLGVPVDTRADRLGTAAQRLVMIGRALFRGGRVLMLDEPTTGLAREEIGVLFTVLEQLRADGTGIVYSSHQLEEILRLADRVVALKDGAVTGEAPRAGLHKRDLIRMIVGGDLEHVELREHAKEIGEVAEAEPMLRVEGLTGSGFADIGFEVRRGEVLGIAGLVGSGRTELVRAVYGADPLQAGAMWLDGRPFAPRSPRDAIAAGVAFVPEDRRAQGGVGIFTARENITLSRLRRFARAFVVSRRRERAAAEAAMRSAAVRPFDPERQFQFFSGGNQQKLVILRGLLTEPKLFILDEPSVGVDVGARDELYVLIRELAARGAGVLLISSDLEEIERLADRAVVLRGGRLVAELDRDSLDETTILNHCFDHVTA